MLLSIIDNFYIALVLTVVFLLPFGVAALMLKADFKNEEPFYSED